MEIQLSLLELIERSQFEKLKIKRVEVARRGEVEDITTDMMNSSDFGRVVRVTLES